MTSPDSLPPAAVLDAFALAGGTVTPVESGLINRHWVVTKGDVRVVVRRYAASRTRAAVAWEQGLVELAEAKGWPVAAARRASGGQGDGEKLIEVEGRLWAAARFLEGAPELEPGPGMHQIQGRLLGRLHRDLTSFEIPGQRPDFGKTWELDAWLAPANVGTFNEVLAQFGREHGELAGLVRRYRYRSLRELSRLHYPDLPDLPIHGDFQRFNLLWSEGQLTGLLDFDFARRDALACDLAVALVPFEPLPMHLAGPLIEGYETERPLSDLEWELMPALARASLLWWVALLLAGWRTGENPAALAGITRTMNVRMPAIDAWERPFRAFHSDR